MTARRVVALQHESVATLGWLGEVLAERGVKPEVRDIRGGEALPHAGEVDALISLGGDLAAYDEDTYPWLAPEKRLLAKAVAAEVPVLGICLGGQLLADAMGGRTYRAPESEIAFLELQLTAAGRDDPVLHHLDAPTLLWHGDTFDAPPGASVLAVSQRYPQAFRLGSGLGLQFHPETSPEMLRTWVSSIGRDPVEGAEQSTRDTSVYTDLLTVADRVGSEMRDSSRRMFSAWADEVGL